MTHPCARFDARGAFCALPALHWGPCRPELRLPGPAPEDPPPPGHRWSKEESCQERCARCGCLRLTRYFRSGRWAFAPRDVYADRKVSIWRTVYLLPSGHLLRASPPCADGHSPRRARLGRREGPAAPGGYLD